MLTNTHEVIKRITGSLFTAEERRLQKVREKLISSNKELNPKPHDGFTYQGKPYDPSDLPRGPRVRVRLHYSLTDEMDAYLKDLEQVWSDRHTIAQMLAVILKPCESAQDIRDVLPECLVDTLDDLKKLPRMREPAFTIQHDTRTVRQYRQVLPRIEFYSTARLLY